MKKSLFLLISILAIVIVGFFSYYLLFGRQASETTPSDAFPVGRPSTQFPDTGSGFGGGGFGDTGGENAGGTNQNILPIGGIGTGAFTPPTLRKLSDEPSAGSVAFVKASTTRVRFTERATGHVYEANTSDLSINRISNTTIPRVHEALWVPDGSGFYARYLRNGGNAIETYAARINETTGGISGTFLPANITAASVGPDGRLAVVLKGETSNSIAVYSITGDRIKNILSSPFSEWLPVWSGSGTVFAYTKPTHTERGESLRITIASTAATPSVRGVFGLSLNPSSNPQKVLYSTSNSASTRLFAYDFSKEQALSLPLSTIAHDKCVWSRRNASIVYCAAPSALGGSMPDRWYQGETSFNDSLWKIDTVSGTVTIVGELRLENEFVDAFGLTVSADDTTFSFINKKDLTPWMLTIK